MILDVPCKTGRLQVAEEGIIRIVAAFGKGVQWQVPCSAVMRITAKDGFVGCSDISIHTEQGQYQADMVSKPNASKLYALFPNLEVGSTQPTGPNYKQAGIFHNKWYQDNKLRTYIVTYTKQKDMQKEVGEAGQYGWVPQNTATTGGHISAAKILTGAVLTAPLGGIGAILGAGRSKDKITITFVRTPEWLAQNS